MTFDSESELQKIRKIVDQQKEKDVPVVEVRRRENSRVPLCSLTVVAAVAWRSRKW